jgi:hypothetical protein
MPNSETQPSHHSHSEHYRERGEKKIAEYAKYLDAKGKPKFHVREYDSYDPRLAIDLGEDASGKDLGKIIADNFTMFEWGISTRLDRVDLIRSHHHRGKLLFQIGEDGFDENGVYLGHKVYAPGKFIGYAYGDNLDYYMASLFHDDPALKAKAQEGGAGFDEAVQKYLAKELDMPGLDKPFHSTR